MNSRHVVALGTYLMRSRVPSARGYARTMLGNLATVAALIALTAPCATEAGAGAAPAFNRLDALPSCYQLMKLPAPPQPVVRRFFVLIDQTTLFDTSLKQVILTAVRHNLRPGTQFAFGTFSAFLNDHYTDVALAGRIDVALTKPERDDTGKTKLRALDQCRVRQLNYAHRIADAALAKAFAETSPGIARSDVFASLNDFATHVVQPGGSETRTLLIASDMLENSSLSSFYSNRVVRRVDPAAELARLKEKGLVPNLAGVHVYVIGAGLLTSAGASAQASYRDPKTMLALDNFWTAYFKEAGALLVEFGKPQLLRAVD